MISMISPPVLDAILFQQRMDAADSQRRLQYKRNREYYNGIHKLPLKTRMGQSDDNVVINLARLVVDKGASFLFGKEVVFELQEGEQTEAETTIDLIWQRNRKMTFLGKLAVTGGIYGHVFIKIVPDGITEGIPRLISLDPEYVCVFYDDQDIDNVYGYRIEWSGADKNGRAIHRRQDVQKDDSDRWSVINRVNRGGADWEPDAQNPDMIWPWDWPPIIDCQNIAMPGDYYGLSDLEDLSEQDAINYVASKINRILRYHSHPKTIGKGFAPKDIKIAEDDTIVLPSLDSELFNLEMQSDLSASLAYLDRLTNWFLATARIPRIDPAVVQVGAMSGFALKVLYGDLYEKTEIKRRTYGDMLVELNRRLCEMDGYGDDNITTLHWPDPLPEDYAASQVRDTFDLDYELASKETVRARRGLDNEVEIERRRGEEAESGNVGALLLRNWQQAQGTLQKRGQGELQGQTEEGAR